MWKLSIFLLIALAVSISGQAYQPPTDQELWAWWESLGPAAQVEQLRNLDIIEHTVPAVQFPDIAAILTVEDSLIITLQGPVLVDIHYLSYAIDLPPRVIPNFIDMKTTPSGGIVWGFIGLAAGCILGLIL